MVTCRRSRSPAALELGFKSRWPGSRVSGTHSELVSTGAAEVAQWSGALAALQRTWVQFPEPRGSSQVYNFSFRGSNALSGFHAHCMKMAHRHASKHPDTQN